MTEDEKVTLIPTSSMDFEKQVLILRAYVVLTNRGKNPVHYKKVMSMTLLARTQISGVNAFFLGLGFLTRVEKGIYSPVKEVVDFYSEKPGEENFSALTPILERSALFAAIQNMILIHGHATEKEIIEYLLEASGEKTVSRAKRALQWLEKAMLIFTNSEGQIRVIPNRASD